MPPLSPVPDLCVIGGGTAGHAVALAAAALGARCTVIDPRDRLGRGQAADLAETLLFAAAGTHPRGTSFDLHAFRRRAGEAITSQAPLYAAARLRSAGVTVVRGSAAFADPRTITVEGVAIRARRFVIATGAREPETASGAVLRPSALLALEALPPRVAIRAAMPAGLEWAQALARLGTAVALALEPGATDPFDPEAIHHLMVALRRDGVDVLPAGVRPDEGCPALAFLRPLPATAGLALPVADIAAQDGAPVVDGTLRTSNPRVFAVGDVLGRSLPGQADAPSQVGAVLRAALFRQPVRGNPAPVPIALRTHPPVAQVGVLSAGAPGTSRRVLRSPQAAGVPGGVKIVATGSGTVLGAVVVGPGAADTIGPWTLAIAHRIPLAAMATLPVPAASGAEAARRAALGFVTARLRSPWIKRLIGWGRLLP